MKLSLTLTVCLLGLTARAAEVVTYPAPSEEKQPPAPYEVWAGEQRIDVYSARTLDAPFAGKEWDYGGPYYFANFDMNGPVVIRITSPRALGKVIIRPESRRFSMCRSTRSHVMSRLDRRSRMYSFRANDGNSRGSV
jgi:hypothetical protein